MDQSSQIPTELIVTHQFYNRIFFNERTEFTKELEEFVSQHPCQLRQPNTVSRLAVNKRILNLAFTNLFAILGEKVSQKIILDFCSSATASTSLIIHKKIEDFYHFFKLNPKTKFQIEDWEALENDYLQYQLLYVEFSLDSNDTRKVADPQSIMNECSIQWQTPWQINSQTLYLRNPETLLIEKIGIRDENLWLFLKQNPRATFSQITEKNRLDDPTKDGNENSMSEFHQILAHLNTLGAILILQG